MRRTDWLFFVLLPASSVLFAVNILFRSPIIGAIATIIFLGSASAVLGNWLYRFEKQIFRFTFGVLTLLMLLSVVGAGLVILGQFTELSSLLTLLTVYVVLIAALSGKNKVDARPQEIASVESKEAGLKAKIAPRSALILPFMVSAVAGFLLLLLARTGEGGASVWLSIPTIFAAVYLICAFSLFVLVFFSRISDSVKLTSICILSLLSHSLFILVWYPGRYGDPWSHLGEVRYIVRTGVPYAYSWMVQNGLWVDLIKFRAFHTLAAFLERMLYFDLYWIYIFLVPVLWSIFTPLLAYRTAEAVATRKSRVFPYLAAIITLIFSSLVAWGAVSVPNSLGFLFFYLSVLLLLLWIKQGGKRMWLTAAVAVAASSLAHPQAGVFAIMFLVFVTVIQKIPRKSVWILSFLGMFVLYPFALFFQNSQFALAGLIQMSSFLSFQSEISTILLVFGLVGLVLGIRGKYVGSKVALLLFSFYTIILLEYYITKYGMTNLPYGPTRILAMADFLLVPLVALGFWTLIDAVRRKANPSASSSLHLLQRKISIRTDSRMIGLLLVGLFLSLQATSILYQAYPLSEIVKVQPSEYEVEAIQFIDQNSPGRYVVLCEPGFSSLAVGFLGADYGYLGGKRGLFGYPEWWYPTVKLYLEMTNNPSIGILQEAINFAEADLGYFVISVRNPDFDTIIRRVLDIFPGYETFGNDQLYVFWYPLPIYEKEGSPVTVIFDDGLGGEQNITTRLSYMTESETNATLSLNGHTSYRVQNLPQHWTFRELTINGTPSQFDNTSDINSFVYVRGLQPSDMVTFKWLFNAHYTKVGWKEDSFKGRVWRQGPYVSNATPTITTDGNILTISHSFTAGSYQYYYYSTSVDLSTNDYPYVLMRWRADQSVAIAAVYFDAGGSREIVQLGSMSDEWSSIFVELPANVFVRTIMVGFNNARNQRLSGPAEIQIDYILFSAKSTP